MAELKTEIDVVLREVTAGALPVEKAKMRLESLIVAEAKPLEEQVVKLNEKIDFLREMFSTPHDEEDAFEAILECPHSDFNHFSEQGCPSCKYYEQNNR